MIKNIVFICENPQEVQSLLPVARRFMEYHGDKVNVDFLSLDGFYLQSTEEIFKREKISFVKISPIFNLKKPINFYNKLQKFIIFFFSLRQAKKVSRGYDCMVCGVDGRIQRIFISEMKKGSKPTFQIINALLFNIPKNKKIGNKLVSDLYQFIRVCLIKIGVCFLRTKIGVGQGGCDNIFVMGEYVKRVLAKRGIKANKVVSSGIPRFKVLFKKHKDGYKGFSCSRGKSSIIYISGAYLWHGDVKGHKEQQERLQLINKSISKMSQRYELVIKLHPRERREFYKWTDGFPRIKLVRGDLYEWIGNSGLVLSTHSTVLLEAVLLNRVSAVVDFQMGEEDKYCIFPKAVPQFSGLDRLIVFIKRLYEDIDFYQEILKLEKRIVFDFIDKKTPRSDEIIANEIFSYLNI
jgi:hypothetical protein